MESETTIIRKQTKLGRLYESYAAIPPIWLDGCIAVGIAMLTGLSMSLSQKESYEYINPTFRYWLVLFVGCFTQGMHALSKFRDGSYAKHMDAKEKQQIAKDTTAALAEHPEGVLTQVTEQTTRTVQEAPPAEIKTTV